jgi:hypothetical protein
VLIPMEGIIYINSLVYASVCRGHETHITFKTVPPELEGPKTIQDLNHTLLLLYLPSPES